ncbi:Eco57I restriction-modification methylase domain-containing protein [Thermococcus camini]|uniref:site-specific DNA-methyltransferase (adenine-specific) n=1 Tax=Thermococcus camini TaxID=2016373 RepID=A0A7G2DAB1_9EURY|nr:Eco57I restriction-modification methylase domain-containing protein [Thermococcus camini]CAD5245187.1 protein of unknown function [Thermococcus camini]
MRRGHGIVWKDFLDYETLKEKLKSMGYPELDNVKTVWQTWYKGYSEKEVPPGDEVWFRLRPLDMDPVEDRDRILIIKNCGGKHRDCVSYLRAILNRETIGLVDPAEDYGDVVENMKLLSKEELRRTSLPGRPQYAIVFSKRGLTFIGPSATQSIDTIIKSPGKISTAFQEKLKSLARSFSKPEKYVVVSIDKLTDKSVAKYYLPKVWQEIFDRRDIIEEFFQLFKLARDYMYRELQGITDDMEKRQFVDEFMLQLLIVWYLQSKGFLPEGNEKPYLIEKFLEVKDKGEYSYFEFLKKLFNVMMGNVEGCELGEDGAFAECPDLGRVFITGPAPFLTSLEKIEQVRIPNRVFYFSTEDGIKRGLHYLITVNPLRSRGNKNLLESMLQDELNEGGVPVLAIFESRDWTVEGVDGEIDRYVIGAIFEKLLDPEARKGRGAYYTPEEITKYIAENTIKPYLIDKLNQKFGTKYQTLDEFFNDEKADRTLKERQYEFLFNELRNLKVLDPAVGSGHFLESAIEVLVDIYRQIRNAVLEYGFDELKFTITTADKKGELVNIPITKLRAGDEFKLKIMFYVIISRNIYGVDIDPRAVSLARARLFLTLTESFDPSGIYIRFPNVHFNIRPGNSLIGFTTIEELQNLLMKEEKNRLDRWLTLTKRPPRGSSSRANLSLSTDTKEYIESIEKKLNSTTSKGVVDELRILKANLDSQLTRELMMRFLRLKSRLAEILLVSLDTRHAREIIRLLEEMTGAVNGNLNREFAEILAERIREKEGKKGRITSDQLKELLDDLSKIGSFHWPWEFPEVFMRENPGFDVVIGNPPYGEINRIVPDEDLAKLLSLMFKSKKVSGYRLQGEGRKVNIYKVFLERSYDLLTTHGYFGMIFPAPFLNDSTSIGLRKTFFEKGVVERILEFPEKTRVFKGVTQAVTVMLLQKVYEKDGNGETGDYDFGLVAGIAPPELGDLDGLTPVKVNKTSLKGLTDGTYTVPLIKNQEEWDKLSRLSELPKLNTFGIEMKQGDINETKDKEFLGDEPGDPKVLLIKGIHLDRYYVDLRPDGPKPRWVKDFNRLLEKYPSVSENIKKERIGWRAVVNKAQVPRLKFSLIPKNVVLTHAVDFMVVNEGGVSPKYLLALLNSRLLDWFFQKFSSSNNVTMPEVRRLPIVIADKKTQSVLGRLVEYLTFLKVMEREARDKRDALRCRELFKFFDDLREVIVCSLYFGEKGVPVDEIEGLLEDIQFDEWFAEYHIRGLTGEREKFDELSKEIFTRVEKIGSSIMKKLDRERIFTALQYEPIIPIEKRFQRPLI